MLRKLLGLGVLVPVAALATQPANNRLTPVGPWQVDYAPGACLLVRAVTGTTGINQFMLVIEPFDRGAEVRLKGEGRVSPAADSADLLADNVIAARAVRWRVLPLAGGGSLRIAQIEDRQHVLGGMTAALSIRPGRTPGFDIQLPDFPSAARALDRCVDHLHRGLGVEPDAVRAIAAYPKGRASTFISPPRKQAFAKIFYWVAPSGQVEGCRVLAAGPDRGLNARVCREVEARARLIPAQDASGKPIRAPKIEFIGNVLVRVS